VLLVGLVMIAAGLVLLAQGPMMSDYLRDLLLPMVLLGIGGGLAFPALTIVAMADATPSDSGLASGLLNTTMQVGASLGLAILATLSSTRTGQLLADGRSLTAALSGGYHLAWAIGAGLTLLAIALAATVLRRGTSVQVETENTEDAVEEENGNEQVEVCA